MSNTKIFILSIGFAIMLFAATVMAEFATTRAYFNVPSDRSFQIAMPSAFSFQDINASAQGNATETDWISFNFTTAGPEKRPACRKGIGAPAGPNCQNETYGFMNWTIMRIDNVGNTAINITMYINESMPTSTEIEVNSTSDNGAGVAEACGTKPTSGGGLADLPNNISDNTNTAGALFVWLNIPSASCFVNVSMWGYLTASGVATGQTTTNIITNSSV